MTNEKIFTNEIISDTELDNISGGTVAQFNDIWEALEKQDGAMGKVDNTLGKILDMLPGGKIGKAAWRNIAAPLAETALKKCYGIDANISIGFVGTGGGESGNSYKKNGQSISHQDVLNIINAA